MSDTVIQVENLSKKYLINHQNPGRDITLREKITDNFKALGHRLIRLAGKKDNALSREEFWALKDVSFEVKQGDRLGLIGRNGAGKSTLLKILSRITAPTSGQVTIQGRVASLLEVGTGFHPDLTGRENIFLNGAVLGMEKAEIIRKFDEIVEFSGVEKFLDTPVKRYSSGMYVRLAFAVSAHLESEILIVDEVLSVGDAAFQKKCLEKIESISTQGRTILFVSHNMATLQTLCQRGLLLQDRTIKLDAPMNAVVREYLQILEQDSLQPISNRLNRTGKGATRLSQVKLLSDDFTETKIVMTGQSIKFVFEFTHYLPKLRCAFTVYNQSGQVVTHFSNTIYSPNDRFDETLENAFVCCIDELLLVPGRYRIDASIVSDHQLQDHLTAAIIFDVEPGTLRNRQVPTYPTLQGTIAHPHLWIIPQE